MSDKREKKNTVSFKKKIYQTARVFRANVQKKKMSREKKKETHFNKKGRDECKNKESRDEKCEKQKKEVCTYKRTNEYTPRHFNT